MVSDIEATVDEAIATMDRMGREIERLRKALAPFVAAFRKSDHPGNSDLDNEQPMSVRVTLGDCRRANMCIPYPKRLP